MKKTLFSFATLAKTTAMLMLACAVTTCFTACSSDDEPSVNELLSDKTTPIAFVVEQGTNFLFDYAGNKYVGSDTISVGWGGDIEIDLRQGKHKLFWLTGLDEDDVIDGNSGLHFDPATKSLSYYGESYWCSEDVRLAQYELHVTEYLLPAQELEYTSLTARVSVEVTDNSPVEGKSLDAYGWRTFLGTMNGYPNVTYISLLGGQYTMGEPLKIGIYNSRDSHRKWESVIVGGYVEYLLCPKDGIDNIQLTADVKDDEGQLLPTTTLPKFSVRRGYTTILRGPLFSGTTSDWTVEMVAY